MKGSGPNNLNRNNTANMKSIAITSTKMNTIEWVQCVPVFFKFDLLQLC